MSKIELKYHYQNRRLMQLFLLGLSCLLTMTAWAGEREQAQRLHDRLAGVPPSAAILDSMEADILAGYPIEAAKTAMKNDAFYNVTLKNYVTPWTNEEQTLFAPLNDYTATVIGMIRDDVPFNELLSINRFYVGDPSLGLTPYSMTNNNHYEELEASGVSLQDELVYVLQSDVTTLPANATAGVATSRANAKAFMTAGTNRAQFRFTILNQLCTDLEQIKDNTRSYDRITQDASRSPGGDSRIFFNSCAGCHTGMDPMNQAFAYYDYDVAAGRIDYNGVNTIDPDTGSRVQGKYHINADNFKDGYIVVDDHWANYWREGQNSLLGWDINRVGEGNGPKSLGEELGNSEAFAKCQVKKSFKTVCFRAPINSADQAKVVAMTSSFKDSDYNMKQVFAEAAVYCMGD
ncbi:MAG: hypothetical protein L3J28_04945 [Candidatus Polarisedimenticolaceae bacterium]|nr:hypothetical protein [Candidatus Polarisedimenticolaceae bacterium]